VRRPRHLAPLEAGAEFEGLGRGDAEHSVCELGGQLVEAGLAEADGAVADHAGDGAADAVVAVAELGDLDGHALRGFGVGAADGEEVVDAAAGDGGDEGEEGGVGGGGWVLGGGVEEVLVADGGDPGYDLDAEGLGEVFLGDGAGGDAADGFAGAAAAAAATGFDAVFVEVGVVCVAGAGVEVHGAAAVVFGSLVFVADDEGYGGA